MLTLTAAGQPSTTMTLRRIQLAKMARDIGGDPADVTAEKLVAWFGSQPGWKIETRRNYRRGAWFFFRWAYRTKRLPDRLARRAAQGTRATRCATAGAGPGVARGVHGGRRRDCADAAASRGGRHAPRRGRPRPQSATCSKVPTAHNCSCTARALSSASSRSATHLRRRYVRAPPATRRARSFSRPEPATRVKCLCAPVMSSSATAVPW